MINENEIPEGSKKIYLAKITGDIIRIKYKKTIKEKFSFEEVYKQDEEKNVESYFMKNVRIKLKLDKDEESFKITDIEKLKYIGFSLPEIQ